jgi:hypothetical protein
MTIYNTPERIAELRGLLNAIANHIAGSLPTMDEKIGALGTFHHTPFEMEMALRSGDSLDNAYLVMLLTRYIMQTRKDNS